MVEVEVAAGDDIAAVDERREGMSQLGPPPTNPHVSILASRAFRFSSFEVAIAGEGALLPLAPFAERSGRPERGEPPPSAARRDALPLCEAKPPAASPEFELFTLLPASSLSAPPLSVCSL